ncbi:MAG: alcohol dehydrogenase catalytic domain-containing protein, partial [Alphaproteobacteria bacterium]
METFTALVIRRDKDDAPHTVAFEEFTPAELMDGDVDVRVEHSTVNYKDGLAITGKLPVVRRFPMIPGIDLAGTVVRSDDARYAAGDRVILNGWGVGEVHLGGYSQMARLKGDWLLPLPAGISGAEAMAVGTAGYTAMLAVMALEDHGVRPAAGPVVVTGAAGGLGSMAVTFLAAAGYAVHAVTGRAAAAEYLTALGAQAIVPREEVSGKPR